MAHPVNPMPVLPPPPVVSRHTVNVAGLLVDFYGLDELPADTASVSVLWLHHPRLRNRGDMADIAARTVHAVAEQEQAAGRKHRLIAAAFDQRNHGSRLVSDQANQAWREGNPTHAQDMLGIVSGTVADTRLLIDLVGSYRSDSASGSGSDNGILPTQVAVTQHLVLGVSLGGHSGWQILFADERVTAGVLVIGCPDYMNLLSDRARLSKLETFTASQASGGSPFLGSRDFPEALVDVCRKYDPRGIVFGTAEPGWPSEQQTDERERLHAVLQQRVAGKRFLVCSGGADKLVPYALSKDFLTFFKDAAAAWPDLALGVRDIVYDGVGHAFSQGMVADAVQFVTEQVAEAKQTPSWSAHGSSSSKTSKI